MNYLLNLLIFFEIYLILALSLNLLVGNCGLLSLCHSGFYAIGCYAYAILAVSLHWGPLPALVVALFTGALVSLAVSLQSWRLHGDFFVLGTLSVQALIYSVVSNWADPGFPIGSWKNLTNGTFGITGIPPPSIFGIVLSERAEFFLFSSFISLLAFFILRTLQTSPWNRLLMAMRDDELAARNLGKNTRLAKVQAFAVAGSLASAAGVIYASYVRYIDPSSASLDDSIFLLSMVIIGGLGNFKGPILGAGVLISIPEILRLFHFSDTQTGSIRLLIYGLFLVCMMHLRPQGLLGEYRLD